MEFAAYRKEVELLQFGKLLPDAIYLHKSALPDASKALTDFTDALMAEYAADFEWDVAKFFRRDFKLSFLSYPTFFDESYPALTGSVTIDLVRGQSRKTDYSKSDNPPILHRKETLIGEDHAAYADFVAITREGEAIGLYEKSTRIGFKKSWERLISNKGYTLVDGRLVGKATIEAVNTSTMASEVRVERHLTAIDRDRLSAPVQSLARHGYLDGDYTFLDYGCGKGHDILELEAHGINAVGWDPEFRPEGELRVTDVDYTLEIVGIPATTPHESGDLGLLARYLWPGRHVRYGTSH